MASQCQPCRTGQLRDLVLKLGLRLQVRDRDTRTPSDEEIGGGDSALRQTDDQHLLVLDRYRFLFHAFTRPEVRDKSARPSVQFALARRFTGA